MLRATGGVMLAPAIVILAALVVGVGGGGLGALPSLRQIFEGPVLSPVEAAVAASGRDTTTGAGELLADAFAPASPAALRRRAGGEPLTPDGSRRRSRPGGARPNRPTRPTAKPGPGARPAPSPQNNGSGAPSPQPTPTPTPGPIRQAGNQAKDATKDVPVVGPAAGGVIDLVVDNAEELIPPG